MASKYGERFQFTHAQNKDLLPDDPISLKKIIQSQAKEIKNLKAQLSQIHLAYNKTPTTNTVSNLFTHSLGEIAATFPKQVSIDLGEAKDAQKI